MCFYMVLDTLRRSASARRLPLCLSGHNCKWSARRMQSRARSSYTEPQPTLAEHFPNALQRYNIFHLLPNYGHRFGAIFSTNLTNWCFQHRVCSRSAELMRAWFCTRLIAVFERTVISRPRIRNFRAFEITFHCWRSTSAFSVMSHCNNVTL